MKKDIKKLTCLMFVLLLIAAIAAGCGPKAADPDQQGEEEPEERTVTITDMSGDEVTITGEVKSIVNLWPAGTASFFVMGAGDLIVGLAVNSPATMNSWTELFYPGASDIPELGGITPSIEDIINLEPDLVIIHPSTAKDGFAEQIREVGIPAINIYFDNYATMIDAYTCLLYTSRCV